MWESDFDYYRRRAEEEVRAAQFASNTAAAEAHRELARRYLARLETMGQLETVH